MLAKHYIKGKFVLVGVWNTIFGYSVFYFLDTFFSALFAKYVAYLSAMVLSNVLSIINAYICHKYITFVSKVKGKGLLVEFIRFSMTYGVTFCLSLILLPLFVEIFNLSPKISGAVIIPLCMIVSFLGHSRFSFHAGERGKQT